MISKCPSFLSLLCHVLQLFSSDLSGSTYFMQNVCWQNCRYWTPSLECSEQIFFSPSWSNEAGKRRSKVKVPVMWYRKHHYAVWTWIFAESLVFFAKLIATLKQVTNVVYNTSSVWHVLKCIGCLVNLFLNQNLCKFYSCEKCIQKCCFPWAPGNSLICDIEYAGMSAGQNSTDCNSV